MLNPIELARICMRVLTSGERRRFRANDETRKVLARAIDVGGWPVFEQVIGSAFEQHQRVLFRLGGPFSRQDFLTRFPVENLMRWVEADVPRRLSFVAHSVPVSGEPLNPHARELLVRWGDRKEVMSALAATFGSGSWQSMGPTQGPRWGPPCRWNAGPQAQWCHRENASTF